MIELRVAGLLSNKILRIASEEGDRAYGPELWTTGKLRKAKACCACKENQPVGSMCFYPITNGYNRMWRLCEGCAARLVRDYEQAQRRSGTARSSIDPEATAPRASKARREKA